MLTIIHAPSVGKTRSAEKFLSQYTASPFYYHDCTKLPVLDWRATEDNALVIYDEAHYLFRRLSNRQIHAPIFTDLVSQKDSTRNIILLTQSPSLIYLPIVKESQVLHLEESFLAPFARFNN